VEDLSVRDLLVDVDEEIVCADGFDDALVGYVTQFNRGPLALYDWDKCVKILMERDGMSEEEAAEFMDFNVTGSWVGERTPAFARFLKVGEP
jgi:hypothetical protein